MRKVVPFMESTYLDGVNQKLFKLFAIYISKYNGRPTKEAFKILCEENQTMFSEQEYTSALEFIETDLFKPLDLDDKWFYDETEKWCQDRALFNAIVESVNIIDGKHKTLTKNALPDILQKALSVSFDTNVGHDYLHNVEERYDYYHATESKLPFDLELLNQITGNGLPNKSLTIVMAGTGGCKSLFMTHTASHHLANGKNVLYITMEMSQEKTAERVDANLLDVEIDQIENMSKKMFMDAVHRISDKTTGNLIIKEYPTGGAHVGHFRALLNELKLKRKFTPDIIFIDYLNICASSRIKSMGGSINSYTYVKSIAEEIRGLAVEFDVPIVSATQVNRSGFNNSDFDLSDTSESFGLPATCDLMFGLITTEELEQLGQIMVKQLKNRYGDINRHKRFCLGVNKAKMKLYDLDESEQTPLVDDTPQILSGTATVKGSLNDFKDFEV
jgi:archaellum biogenesis ATPase FlaH